MSRPKCEVCGKEICPDEYRDFEGTPLCETHAVAIHRFIELMKQIPKGVCLLIQPKNLEQGLAILQSIMEAPIQ